MKVFLLTSVHKGLNIFCCLPRLVASLTLMTQTYACKAAGRLVNLSDQSGFRCGRTCVFIVLRLNELFSHLSLIINQHGNTVILGLTLIKGK